MRKKWNIITAVWITALICGLAAHAVQYVVPGGAGDQTGSSWANARADVQAAVNAAALPGEEVWVAAGRYQLSTPLIMRSDSVVLGGFAGTETEAAARDCDANLTVLDGLDTAQVVRMVSITNSLLDGPVVTRGYVAAATKAGGGGILIKNSSNCIVRRCKILYNTSVRATGATSCEGGGILLTNALSCVIEACLFTGNSANSSGTSISLLNCPGTIINACRFVGDWQSTGAGVIRVNNDGPKYFNCVASGNSVSYGGFLYGSQLQTIYNCTVCFTSNSTNGAFAAYSTEMVLRNSIFAYNAQVAVAEMNTGADATVANNLFYGQTKADFYDNDTTSFLTGADAVNNSSVPDNASGNVDGDPKFVRCPTQDDGNWTAVHAYDQDRTQTTLVDANAAFRPGVLKRCFLNPDTAETLYRHAEIADNTATSITVWGKAAWAAASTGYRIYDYHLRRDSPAVDAGLAAGAPGADIDGYARRPNVNGIDMGAYELQRKQGTMMLLSTPLPEPIWRVYMTSEAAGNVVTVSNATLAVTVTEGVSWTIRTLHAGGTLLVGAFGANGAVANVKTAVYPQTDGWMGTGHGFETVSSYTVMLDGTNATLQVGGYYAARTVTLTKESTIGPLDQIATMTFPETGDRFVENTRFTANRSLTDTLNFVYAYMHCHQNALTDWRAWLTETNILDGACTLDDTAFQLQKDVRAVALFGPSLNRGLLYVYPEIYQGSGIYNAFWDRVNDNKLYFRPKIPGLITAPGETCVFDVTLIPFQADSAGWKDKAAECLLPFFGPQ